MISDERHEVLMGRAIEAGLKSERYPFGAVIVHVSTGEVLVEAFNESSSCPTLHAELNAIQQCSHLYPDIDGSELALYSTAEPCPMCMGAIAWAGIHLVYYGASILTLKKLGLRQMDIRASEMAQRTPFMTIRLFGGILEDECASLFAEAAQDVQQDGLQNVSTEMLDHSSVTCPHCGERIDVNVELASRHQQYIEDCSVCCQPMMVLVDREADGIKISAVRPSD